MARSMRRPVVVLPHPLSPTSPSVSPGSTVKLTPSTARTTRAFAAERAGEEAAAQREVLREVVDSEEGRPCYCAS